ncbi:MAG: carotenoid oxygenase family protein [Ilumatobacteraceae bacterium]
MTLSRRDLIRWSATGLGVGSVASLLAACSDDAIEGSPSAPLSSSVPTEPSATAIATDPLTTAATTTAATTTTATIAPTPTTTPFESNRPWWLQGNFAPVANEVESVTLSVTGSIPPELSGLFVRNGSNPSAADSPHWFLGDGMMHGLRVSDGQVEWYRNRYVNTTMYQAHAGFGQGPPGAASNQSNVSCIWHSGKLLTSGEVGFPYHVDPTDLTTVGPYDFDGVLTSAFTAHPKIDPDTGRMHSFGYGFTAPFLTYHVTEADGTMVHTETVDIPRSVMMHDFAITESDAVFWDLPVVFDLDVAVASMNDPNAAGFPYRWQPDAGARVGVMPLAGGASAIQWFDIDPCFVFHGVNAFRRGGDVVIDVCHLDSMFEDGQVLGGAASLRRWTLDTAAGTAAQEVLETEQLGDLPSRDPRRVGREHRYGYLAATRPNADTVELGGLIKHDFVNGSRDAWDPGPTSHCGEWLFVPAGADLADDAGYLLAYLHDEATGVSEFVIVDATRVGAGPIARVALPQRVPYGFHATWIPD